MKNSLLNICTLMLLVLGSAATRAAQDAGQEPLQGDLRIPLALLAAHVEQEFDTLAKTLEVAAENPQVQSANWDQVKPLLKKIQEMRPLGAYWFALPDGTYFTTEKGRSDQKLNDRPYFPMVMSGKVSIGHLVVGRSTKHNVAIVAVPIKARGEVIGMLGVSVELGPLSNKIRAIMNLKPGMVFYAVDRNGVVALHSEDRIFLETLTLGGSVSEALKKMTETEQGRLSYEFDQTRRDVVYQASPLTGWRFALGRFEPVTKVGQAQ